MDAIPYGTDVIPSGMRLIPIGMADIPAICSLGFELFVEITKLYISKIFCNILK